MPSAASGMAALAGPATLGVRVSDGTARYHTHNQAEYGVPGSSVYGRLLRLLVSPAGNEAQGVGSPSQGKLVPAMASASRVGVPRVGGMAGPDAPHPSAGGQRRQAGLVQQYPGIYYPIGIKVRGQVGVNVVRAARAVPVLRSNPGYAGQLPMSQQPLIKKPLPWSDPTRGQP